MHHNHRRQHHRKDLGSRWRNQGVKLSPPPPSFRPCSVGAMSSLILAHRILPGLPAMPSVGMCYGFPPNPAKAPAAMHPAHGTCRDVSRGPKPDSRLWGGSKVVCPALGQQRSIQNSAGPCGGVPAWPRAPMLRARGQRGETTSRDIPPLTMSDRQSHSCQSSMGAAAIIIVTGSHYLIIGYLAKIGSSMLVRPCSTLHPSPTRRNHHGPPVLF